MMNKANVKIIDGAEPFFFPAGKTGCLLIHGISASPQQFRTMGEYLAGRDITTLGILLKGHGTMIDDLHSCTYQDWIDSAEEGLARLKEHCSSVFCAGLSMGGIITMRLARLHPKDIKGAVMICSPYKMRHPKFLFVPLLKHFIKQIPTGPRAISDPVPEEVKYLDHSVPAAHQLIKLMAAVRKDLPLIKQPVLIFGGSQDWVVDSRDPGLYYEKIGTEQKELVWLENSQHVAVLDYDREIIYQKTLEFINKYQ